MTTTATRAKENGCDFSSFKTPIRNTNLTSNDLTFYSNNNKHLKFIGTESLTTPIRLHKTKFLTPISIQRRRALGHVNHNHNQLSSSDDLVALNDESVILDPEDDLPQQSHQIREDTFDDLIPTNERIEHMVSNQTNGINIFTYNSGIENTIRCQSPVCSRVNLSTLLDILNQI